MFYEYEIVQTQNFAGVAKGNKIYVASFGRK